MSADASMWLGHALAAVLTIAALYRGERLLIAVRDLAAQLIRWVRRRVDHVLVLPDIDVVDALPGRFDVDEATSLILLATLRGRAPPLVAAI